jgi:methylenetetrahydrofolate reductase (NADPH)
MAEPALAAPQPHPACPKQMVYGPCAGLRGPQECEIPGLPCPFVAQAKAPAWAGANHHQLPAVARPAVTSPAGLAFLATMQQRPVIVTDIPTIALDVPSLFAIAKLLHGAADAVLIGDHGGARVQFPPAYRAMLMRQAGLESWVGLNCRDRNRVALEAEIAALAHLGVAGVNCVTGDHTASGHRPDAKAVFDLDSTQLAHLASTAGLLVSVGEKPNAPPAGLRPQRFWQKIRAGAQLGFINMPHSPALVEDFRAAVLAAQAEDNTSNTISNGIGQVLPLNVPFIVGIPVITSVVAMESAVNFYNVQLPAGFAAGMMATKNPRREGIRAAIEYGHTMLALKGVRGLNLSGLAAPGQELEMAADFAEIGRAFL